MKSCKDLKEKKIIFSLLCKAFYAACLGGIQQMRVREWRRWMCSCRSGWTEMEWGEEGAQQGEEGAQQGEEGAKQGEEVGSFGGHARSIAVAIRSKLEAMRPRGRSNIATRSRRVLVFRRIPASSRSSMSNPVCWSCRNGWSCGLMLLLLPRRLAWGRRAAPSAAPCALVPRPGSSSWEATWHCFDLFYGCVTFIKCQKWLKRFSQDISIYVNFIYVPWGWTAGASGWVPTSKPPKPSTLSAVSVDAAISSAGVRSW